MRLRIVMRGHQPGGGITLFRVEKKECELGLLNGVRCDGRYEMQEQLVTCYSTCLACGNPIRPRNEVFHNFIRLAYLSNSKRTSLVLSVKHQTLSPPFKPQDRAQESRGQRPRLWMSNLYII